MRKSLFKKAVALALVCAMTLPSALVASAAPTQSATAPTLSGNTPDTPISGNQQEVSGNGSVDTATYNVILPSNLDFAIDRFEVSDRGQIYGVDYPIVNASPMAVKVNVSVSNNNSNATFVDADNPDLISEEDTNAAFLAAWVPSEVSVSANVSANAISGDTISGNYTDNENVFAITSANGTYGTEFGFKLAKYTDNADLSANNCATFTWTGKVNSTHDWVDGDLKLKGVFTLLGLGTETAAEIQANADNNLIAGGTSGTSATFSRAAAADVVFRFALPAGASSVKSLAQANDASNTIGPFTYGNGALTLSKTSGKLTNGWTPGTYNLKATFDNNESIILKLTITN